MKQLETQFKQVDVFPLVKYYMDELDLFNLFTKYVPSSNGSYAEHAESLCVLTANIICENKPLYKVQEWLSKYSDGFCSEHLESGLFNDDRLGRALSALFDADRHSMMTELSGNAIAVHQLQTRDIHNDTTTVTFKGKYNTPDPEAVNLKHGHNKDYRPDCKQIVFGLNTTSDGHIPLSYTLFNGNTADDTTHIPNWNGLRTLLGKVDFTYIGDCKLCCQLNLNHIAENGGLLITLIPQGRKEVKQFLEHLKKADVSWADAFEVESSRKKGKMNIYRTYESDLTTDNQFRVIFVHSSLKKEEDQKKREKKIEKTIDQLKELSSKLNKYHLKTKKDIKKSVESICKSVKNFVDVRIITSRKQIKVKASPGRPSPTSVYKIKWKSTHRIEWDLNQSALDEASKADGVFALTTNTDLKANDVLRKYKNQAFLEKRMYTKKTVLEVAPVFLKKEKRIEAMLFLYFVALMIVSLIERKIRMNMKKEKVEKLPILPQRMNTKKPTWDNIRYFFRDVHYSEIIQNGICIQAEVKGITDLHEQINHLLEVPDSVYEKLHGRWWQFKET